MKKKDIIALVFFGIILAVITSLIVGKVGGSKNRSAQVEVVQQISPEFSQEARDTLLGRNTKSQVRSFNIPVNVNSGVGNNSPFRPH